MNVATASLIEEQLGVGQSEILILRAYKHLIKLSEASEN
jgi:hypothetical protein